MVAIYWLDGIRGISSDLGYTPLGENAFKHGASGDIDTPKIRINIFEKNKNIHCHVWNTKSSYQGELNDAYKKEIGLSNIKRQLELVYPSRHGLEIADGKSEFQVRLKILDDSPH